MQLVSRSEREMPNVFEKTRFEWHYIITLSIINTMFGIQTSKQVPVYLSCLGECCNALLAVKLQ